MKQQITQVVNRYFSHSEALILLCLMAASSLFIYLFGAILAPFIVSLIVAFLLDALVKPLIRLGIPPLWSVVFVCIVFFGALLLVGLLFLPLLWEQALHLVRELPSMFSRAHSLLLDFINQQLHFLSLGKFDALVSDIDWKVSSVGQWFFSLSLASIPGLLSLLVYFIVVPIMVYFLLIDKSFLLESVRKIFPEKLSCLDLMWQEIHKQISHYVIGKLWESVILALVMYVLFIYFKLNYATILAIAVGISGIIPWVGAVLVTVPLVVIAIFQWGFTADLVSFLVLYCVLIALDANLLVPLLFSETMKMHPIVILMSVIFFGQLWGVAGVFFAIPLAVLIKVMLQYWPKVNESAN